MNTLLKKIYTLTESEQLKIVESILSSVNGNCAYPHTQHILSPKKQIEYKRESLYGRKGTQMTFDEYVKQSARWIEAK